MAADAISREFVGMAELCSLVSSCGVWWESMQAKVEKDAFIQQLKQDLAAGHEGLKGYTLEQNVFELPRQASHSQKLQPS